MSSFFRQLSAGRKNFLVLFTFGAIALFFATNLKADTSTTLLAPTNYTTFQPPAAQGSFADPVFGTTIKRLTNSMTVPRADASGNVITIGPEYSTMSPFNQDNSRVLLQHFSYFALYDGNGVYLKNLPLDINASTEPRWSRTDPSTLYYLRGNQLKQHNVSTGNTTVVAAFSEYGAISGNGESDISFDGKYFVLVGDRRYIFVYDISSGTKGQVLDSGGRSFDSVYMTPNSNVSVTWNSTGTSRFQGVELFDRSMNFVRQLARVGGHMDYTRDTNGDEVLVWANAADPLPVCQNGIVKIRLADASQTCLVSLDWSLATHVSAPDNSGWVMVETYAPGDPMPTSGWKVYTNELLKVSLSGSSVDRIANHRSRPFNSYTYMPKVSVSRDGSKLVFGSNFGLQSILGNPTEYQDAYMINLGAGTPTTTPPPTTTTPPPTTTTPPPTTTTPPPTTPTTPTTPPATGTTVRVEQNNSAVQYTAGWYPNNNGSHSGGSATLAMEAGSRATFTFTGTQVSWIAYRDEWSGIARVYVDGTSKGNIDTYASSAQAKATMLTVSNLAAGTHTLVIEATGQRSSKSQGSWVWIDAFDYANASGTSSGSTTLPSGSSQTGISVTSAGTSQGIWVGHASVASSSTAPAGLAVFSSRQNGIVVTEASVPAMTPMTKGRVAAELASTISTGVALANATGSPATVNFHFTDVNGSNSGAGTLTIPAHGQIARFLDEEPFNGTKPFLGTFSFTSNVQLAAIALRGNFNERSEFLTTTLPIANPDAPPTGTQYFPHFADGGGWQTQFTLVNPTDQTISGTLEQRKVDGSSYGSVAYTIPPRSSRRFATPGTNSTTLVGWAEVEPAASNAAPIGVGVFTFRNGGVTVSEAGVPSLVAGTALRLYAEVGGSKDPRTGVAILNPTTSAQTANIELIGLDGTSTNLVGTVNVPAGGQRSVYLDEIQELAAVVRPFRGIARITSGGGIVVLGIRSRVNERGDYLITTTNPVDEASTGPATVEFPHIADGGGFTTQFILHGRTSGQSGSGTITTYSQSGDAVNLPLQ